MVDASSCQTQFFNESRSLSYAGKACMKLQVANTGTNIFAPSICHCSITTLVHVKMLLVGIIGHFLTSRLSWLAQGAWTACKFDNIKPLRLWSRCDRHCRKSSMRKWRNCTFKYSVRSFSQCGVHPAQKSELGAHQMALGGLFSH